MIKSIKYVSILICFMLTILSNCYGINYYPENLVISNSTKVINIIDNSGTRVDIVVPCCLAQIDKDHLILVNYNQMYVLDTRDGKATLLEKPADVDIWRPTGVKWCTTNQLLYVANYTGKDILTLKLTIDNELKLVKRYTHPLMIGPENIDIYEDGQLFTVADYDSGKILLFNKENLLWSRDVGKAHGIAFDLKRKLIIAAGLDPAKIYEFDLSGKLIKEIGKDDWGRNGYLWPTSIAIKNGQILVADAHTGKISKLNDRLETIQTIGGNGLGIDLFNMPYGIEFTDNQLLYVTDTFKGRILKIDPKTSEILTIYQGREMIVDIDRLEYVLPIESIATSVGEKPQGLTYDERTNLADSIYINFNRAPLPRLWHSAYNKLVSNDNHQLNLSGFTPFISDSYFYWVNAKNYKYKGKDFTIIGSPQAWTWLIIYKGIMYPISIGSDFYFKDNYIISSTGKSVLLDTICEIASFNVEKYIQAVRQGDLPLKAIADHLIGIAKYLFSKYDFESRFKSAFESVDGKIFLNKLMKAKNVRESHEAAKEYLTSIKNDKVLYFFEIAIASTILGSVPASVTENIEVDLTYRATIKDSTPTYPGYSFDIVLNKSDDYAAAIEDQQFPQFVHFEFNEASTIKTIKILWESADNYGTNYDLELYKDNKKIDTVSVNQLKEQTHSITLPKPLIVDSIILRVASTSGQQRILMRQINFMGEE